MPTPGDLSRSLIDAATQAIERVDEGLLPEPAEFFSNSAYGAQAVAAVVAVLETLREHARNSFDPEWCRRLGELAVEVREGK